MRQNNILKSPKPKQSEKQFKDENKILSNFKNIVATGEKSGT